MNRLSVRPGTLALAIYTAAMVTGTTLAASAQIVGQCKTTSALTPVQAHITVTAEPIATQVEKAHEKSDTTAEPLSRVQLERLAANARIYKEKVSPLQAELRLDKRRLMDVLTDESVSVPHAQLLQAKIGLLKSDIRDLQLKKQLADSAIMTPTQRKMLRGQLLRRCSEQHKILALSGKGIQ
ncbi:MAG: hypothetical protein P4L53_26370 [Candidatus Obscuribacterales bacterium]|nr:hypothetical protein [Candidatus Obscuribacterales bacterium]